MKQVNPKVYNKDYYLNVCLGSELFKAHKGNKLDKKWTEILKLVKLKKGMRVLDLGCGRGDLAIFLAKKDIEVVGIDYSKDAIAIASNSLKKMPNKIKELVTFRNEDAKKNSFEKDFFDVVISLDVFEHLYDEELKIVMKNISKILKKNGILLVHTEANKIYLNFTHPFYSYPVSTLLTFLNKIFSGKSYINLPRDPRNEYHKIQHVNEPTIFYLKKLFQSYSFKGKIISNIGSLKPQLSWKDLAFNILVYVYPLSFFWPLNILFATDYVCIMRNDKK